MKPLKLIYLASPYTFHCEGLFSFIKRAYMQYKRYHEISRIAAILALRYKQAMFLPITQSHILRRHVPELGTTFAAWADIDLKAISRSDEVWVVKMEGWKESVGVQAEIQFALKHEIPVRYIDPKTVKFTRG